MQISKFRGRLEWKRTNRRADTSDAITFLANTVGSWVFTVLAFIAAACSARCGCRGVMLTFIVLLVPAACLQCGSAGLRGPVSKAESWEMASFKCVVMSNLFTRTEFWESLWKYCHFVKIISKCDCKSILQTIKYPFHYAATSPPAPLPMWCFALSYENISFTSSLNHVPVVALLC